jgi:hypothetical protein
LRGCSCASVIASVATRSNASAAASRRSRMPTDANFSTARGLRVRVRSTKSENRSSESSDSRMFKGRLSPLSSYGPRKRTVPSQSASTPARMGRATRGSRRCSTARILLALIMVNRVLERLPISTPWSPQPADRASLRECAARNGNPDRPSSLWHCHIARV